jgi:hypothetical protein
MRATGPCTNNEIPHQRENTVAVALAKAGRERVEGRERVKLIARGQRLHSLRTIP